MMGGLSVDAVTSFQFHKGTIRTPHCPKDYSLLPRFQFHKGTIRTYVGTIEYCKMAPISIP